jgi:hypothetical protein
MEKSNPAGDGQLIRNAVLAMQASARRELTIVAEWAERNVIEIGVTHSGVGLPLKLRAAVSALC